RGRSPPARAASGWPSAAPGSLDRDALGQVARLVHVAAALDRDVVREQLEGQDREERRERSERARDVNDVVRLGGDVLVPFGGDRDYLASPRAHLLHVVQDLCVG